MKIEYYVIGKHQCRATIMTNLIYSCDFLPNNIRFIENVPKWYHVMRWNLNHRCSNNSGHFQLSENYWQLVIVKSTSPNWISGNTVFSQKTLTVQLCSHYPCVQKILSIHWIENRREDAHHVLQRPKSPPGNMECNLVKSSKHDQNNLEHFEVWFD